MTVSIGGKTVAYMDSDPQNGDNKPVVLFLHGWGAPVATYALLLNHLAGYCRVVAPDLPGFGGSEEPAEPWTVDAYADWTAAFAEKIGLSRVVLMCHSFGGRISLKLLARRPMPFQVEKAVFLDAAGIRPKRTAKYYAKVYSYKAARWFFSRKPMKKFFPDAVENARKKAGSSDYQQASPVMRQSKVKCINEELTPLLEQNPVSTLLIWGENDTATPLADGRLMEKNIPDAGLVVLPGGGHFAFAEQWELCRRVLDSFLKPKAKE